MSRIFFTSRGSFKNMESFLASMKRMNIVPIIEPLAQEGVRALAAATPRDSGLAAESWSYRIEQTRRGVTVIWENHDRENGFPVVIALQYGYATGTGGYVQGRDFINPAIKPIFDRIGNDVWKVVTSA